MPQVVFAHPVISSGSLAMSRWFIKHGYEVYDRGRVDLLNPPDLVILRSWDKLSYEEVLAAFSSAAIYEEAGVKVVNSLKSHLLMGSKEASSRIFEQAGLPQPELLSADRVKDFPVVVKPSAGSKGRGVVLAEDQGQLEDALGKLSSQQPLVQRFVKGKTVRVVATCDEALYAYSKEPPPGQLIASISQGAEAERMDPIPDEIAELAKAAVSAVGGSIAGVDLILPVESEPLLLELNSSFRIPEEIDGALSRICRAMLDA